MKRDLAPLSDGDSGTTVKSPLSQFVLKFFGKKLPLFGLMGLLSIITLAIVAPLITPQNPYDLSQLDIMNSRLPPGSISSDGSMKFLLGTDDQGRDLFSAIIYGLRISLNVGIVSVTLALIIGVSLGLFATYCGGRIEVLIMRAVDLQLAFPAILVALILLAVLGRGIDKTVLALVVAQWAYFARTVRGAAISELNKEYIEAASCLELSHVRIMFRHLLPNCMPPVIVVGTVEIAGAISLEATLSFLGVGLPVTEPSLGMLIANGFQYMLSGVHWISFYPGMALLVLIVCINLVGDQLRDVLNPRLQ